MILHTNIILYKINVVIFHLAQPTEVTCQVHLISIYVNMHLVISHAFANLQNSTDLNLIDNILCNLVLFVYTFKYYVIASTVDANVYIMETTSCPNLLLE